ncbi:MAG TPA: polyprenyl synthetase family protein [Dehalococcoidia bacterium]|nr:polyprenyl synthetase family protein [Dehalococcoidia bacterium]
MLELSTIYKPIREDLIKVENELRSVSKVDFPWLSELLVYSLSGGGKEIRPALVLLSGKLYDCNLDYLLPMATAVEVVHIATLVHDDAIDKSPLRRGRPTINEVWGEDKAMLLGDYLFAKAGELAANTRNLQVIKLFAQTIQTISSGELNQAFSAFNLEQTRQQYLQRISSKTASLFSTATESGAILSQAPEESIKVLKEYGYNLGIAFQIIDDILDFIGTEEELGKPVGSDLAQGTLTLPAMLLLECYVEDNPVKRLFQNRDKQENIELAIKLVHNSSIIEECYAVAADYCDKACCNFDLLPDCPSRRALMELADYIINRKR